MIDRKRRKPYKRVRTTALFLCAILLACLLMGCASKPQPAAVDLDQQRTEFVSMAQNHVVDEPSGIRRESVTVTEGNYLISADYPVVEASEVISGSLRGFVDQEISAFQTEAESMGTPNEDTGLFALALTYKPYPVGTGLLSVKFTKNANSGKTNVKNYIQSFVYQIATGAQFGIADVFDTARPDCLTILSETVRQYLLANEIVRGNLEENLFQQGTAADAQNFSNFAVTPKNKVLFFFNKGTVAPSEAGTLEVCIPLSDFDAILNPANKELLYGTGAGQSAAAGDPAAVTDPTAPKDSTTPVETIPVDMSEYSQFVRGEEFMQMTPLTTAIDPMNDKVIAFTFDDGPAPATPALLDLLKQTGDKATFFVVGDRIASYEDTLKRIYDEGHEIGSHSYSHVYPTEVGYGATLEEYAKANDAIEAVVGKRTLIDRPPGGYMTEDLAAQLDREQIYWTVDTEDWKYKDDPNGVETIYQNIMAGASDGGIILLHDLYDNSVQAAGRAIADLKAQGYKLVTVTQMLQIAKLRGHDIPYFWNKTASPKEEAPTAPEETTAPDA